MLLPLCSFSHRSRSYLRHDAPILTRSIAHLTESRFALLLRSGQQEVRVAASLLSSHSAEVWVSLFSSVKRSGTRPVTSAARKPCREGRRSAGCRCRFRLPYRGHRLWRRGYADRRAFRWRHARGCREFAARCRRLWRQSRAPVRAGWRDGCAAAGGTRPARCRPGTARPVRRAG